MNFQFDIATGTIDQVDQLLHRNDISMNAGNERWQPVAICFELYDDTWRKKQYRNDNFRRYLIFSSVKGCDISATTLTARLSSSKKLILDPDIKSLWPGLTAACTLLWVGHSGNFNLSAEILMNKLHGFDQLRKVGKDDMSCVKYEPWAILFSNVCFSNVGVEDRSSI